MGQVREEEICSFCRDEVAPPHMLGGMGTGGRCVSDRLRQLQDGLMDGKDSPGGSLRLEDVQELVVCVLDLLHWECEIVWHPPNQLVVLSMVTGRRQGGWYQHLIQR